MIKQIQSSAVQKELSIRSETVQRIYNFYINNLFYVNRRYQRKLVWTIEEKRAFIDSILKGFPVPIILLAQTEKNKISVFEIIDGMQRLNAVTAFIEGEFDIEDKYFDLETMVESKSLLDQEKLTQKTPILNRHYCEIIGSYVLPLSVYSFDDNEKVDEIFRRINSNGKHLSRQELRSAGSTSKFADLVRKIANEIRTDTSASDILLLNNMKQISITNKQLEYGINVDDIFWVKNRILTKEMLRESKDEEIIADVLAYMLLQDIPLSNSTRLDDYYGFREDNEHQKEIESSLTIKQPELIQKQFIKVYDQIRQILVVSQKNFRELICDRNLTSMVRQFQVIFLSFYDLLIKKNQEISNYDKLISELNSITKEMTITTGKTWAFQNKQRNINKIKGIIQDCFKQKDTIDPAIDSWLTEFETLLTQSTTEQSLYDFKQGFTELNEGKQFNQDNFDKIIKTLTAMANHSPNATGYVCVGIADNDKTAKKIYDLYNVDFVEYKNFKITGITHEAERLQGNLDNFYRWIIQLIKLQPINQTTKDTIGREIKVINYKNKSVIIFSLKGGKEPTSYNDKFYQRIGSNVNEIKVSEYVELFRRFSKE
ncbi:GmrSD restriction endonuclease domain-containing protein [Cyanobacterium sp. DS4]|uniref:GmrSD restriction endonuclease domain-containing protein n=1 Tax=Cyanobacterium sp. DS4 TaxID=2878255 RepID=UPI002E81BE34|nr:DUF262 domain-containing protein [Cyanobacterium sp. Dongsha4]WVL00417.1 DUF262 domain-containing protein [Cyanobacterium sp. Dongsha4]